MTILVRYYLAGRLLMQEVAAVPPRRGDEVCIEGQAYEGRCYEAARVVWHKPMCPPDSVSVHLVLAPAEAIGVL